MRLPVIFVACLLASPVAGFTAQNGLLVEPTGAHSFHVPWRGKSGPTAFWCAAGDYAVRVLRLSPATLIYRASEPPRRSGEGIAFSLLVGDAASRTGLAVLGAKGAGLTAGHAQSFCEFRRPRT